MKKIVALILAAMMAMAMVACGGAAASGAASQADGATTLTMDMMSASDGSMDSMKDYISSFVTMYEFKDDACTKVTMELTMKDDMDDTIVTSLQSALAGYGTAEVNGKVITIDMTDTSGMAGMKMADVKSAIEAQGYTVTEG